MLHWDAAAMMPTGGAAARAEQLATLRGVAHEHLTAPEIGDLLAEAEGETRTLDAWQCANLREMRRRRLHAAAVSATLVEAMSRACSECETVWRKARLQNDFAAVLPGLGACPSLEARNCGDQGGASRNQPLRGAARPIRARRVGRDDRPAVRRDRALSSRSARGGPCPSGGAAAGPSPCRSVPGRGATAGCDRS